MSISITTPFPTKKVGAGTPTFLFTPIHLRKQMNHFCSKVTLCKQTANLLAYPSISFSFPRRRANSRQINFPSRYHRHSPVPPSRTFKRCLSAFQVSTSSSPQASSGLTSSPPFCARHYRAPSRPIENLKAI